MGGRQDEGREDARALGQGDALARAAQELICGLRDELQALQGRLEDLESRTGKQAEELGRLHNELSIAEADIAGLDRLTVEQARRIASLEAQLQEARAQIQALRMENSRLKRQNQALARRTSGLKKAQERLEGEGDVL